MAGVTVFADQTQTLSLSTRKSIKQIAQVLARANNALVRSGTTSDVYSVNQETADRVKGLGGGGSLDQVYSSIASVPGVYVPSGANGWFQTVLIRGGDYAQIGYEFDGVPVNRSFDNYPANTASALGQQELQIYTGGGPANAEATGLAGFINQVIKTGSYPGFADANIGLGGPTFYHKFNFEAGGATPNRHFSYYAAVGGSNQDFRVFDQSNGSSLSSVFGTPFDVFACPKSPSANLAGCYASSGGGPDFAFNGPGGYQLGPYNVGTVPAHIADREGVVNLHFAIPHHSDGGRDDIQFLYDSGALFTQLYNSPGDFEQALLLGANPGGLLRGGAPASFPAGYQYNGAVASFLPAGFPSQISRYAFPTNFTGQLTGNVPLDQRDGTVNDQGIVKLQYQRNFSTSAYLRLYGYTFYSDWLQSGPNSLAGFGLGPPADYELSTHSRGLSASFGDQLNAQNLLGASVAYVTATTLRDNNGQFNVGARTPFAWLVNRNNPAAGVCYAVVPPTSSNPQMTTVATNCFGGTASGSSPAPTTVTFGSTSAPDVSGLSCGGGPCGFYVAENGLNGLYNTVRPRFTTGSLTDQFKPNEKLLLNLGVHLNDYAFDGADTTGGARSFWFNAWNSTACVAAGPGHVPTTGARIPGQPCPSGTVPAPVTNAPAEYRFTSIEPRISGTYTLDPRDVLRFSYGKYSQPANAAAEQYNVLQQNLASYIGSKFYSNGFTQPGHNIAPEFSYNADLSFEHQFKGTSASMKVTPFLRKTSGEQTSVFIDPKHAVVSSIPVGNLTAQGVELALQDGDFNRNGFAGQLAYTYTYTTVKYGLLGNGGTVISPINNDIKSYNAYTSFCAHDPRDARCGSTSNGVAAAPCYVATQSSSGTSVAPAPCGAAGAYANPYWNAPVQSLLDPSGPYFPTDTVVSALGLNSGNAYGVPHVATLILNYKRDRLSVTPSLQFAAGQRYGTPESTAGIDPVAGCGALTTSASGDPRYPYGAAGGLGYNAPTCAGAIVIPDPVTGRFDNVGAFVAPSQLLGHLQIAYTASPKVSFRLTLANVINQCFGGSAEPWNGNASAKSCSYVATAGFGAINPVGNFYNPGAAFQPAFRYAYTPFNGSYNPNVNGGLASPFNAFLEMNVRL